MIINRQLRQNIMIASTFLFGFLLTIMPLSERLFTIQPQWIWMILIFWLMEAPEKIGPMIAWCIGLYMDLLLGTVLGEHALLYVLAAYWIQRFYLIVQALPFWQKILGVGGMTFLSLLYQGLFAVWIERVYYHWTFLLPTVTTMLAWPLLYMLCKSSNATYNYRVTRFR